MYIPTKRDTILRTMTTYERELLQKIVTKLQQCESLPIDFVYGYEVPSNVLSLLHDAGYRVSEYGYSSWTRQWTYKVG